MIYYVYYDDQSDNKLYLHNQMYETVWLTP